MEGEGGGVHACAAPLCMMTVSNLGRCFQTSYKGLQEELVHAASIDLCCASASASVSMNRDIGLCGLPRAACRREGPTHQSHSQWSMDRAQL